MFKRTLFSCVAVLIGCSAMAAAAADDKVPVQTIQGRNYDFVLPQGWTVQEANNYLVINAPDGVTRVCRGVEMWSGPLIAPTDAALRTVAELKMTNVQVLSDQPFPVQEGVARVIELSCLYQGVPTRAVVLCQVINGNLVDFAAAQSPAEIYGQLRPALWALGDAMKIARPGPLGTYNK